MQTNKNKAPKGNQRKIFVTSLPNNTPKAEILNYFSKFGEIKSSSSIFRIGVKSTKCLVLEFRAKHSKDAVLNQVHSLNGRYLDCKEYLRGRRLKSKIKKLQEVNVFISGLPDTIRGDGLKSALSTFGAIESVKIGYCVRDEAHYAIVSFGCKEEAQLALQVGKFEYLGRRFMIRNYKKVEDQKPVGNGDEGSMRNEKKRKKERNLVCKEGGGSKGTNFQKSYPLQKSSTNPSEEDNPTPPSSNSPGIRDVKKTRPESTAANQSAGVHYLAQNTRTGSQKQGLGSSRKNEKVEKKKKFPKNEKKLKNSNFERKNDQQQVSTPTHPNCRNLSLEAKGPHSTSNFNFDHGSTRNLQRGFNRYQEAQNGTQGAMRGEQERGCMAERNRSDQRGRISQLSRQGCNTAQKSPMGFFGRPSDQRVGYTYQPPRSNNSSHVQNRGGQNKSYLTGLVWIDETGEHLEQEDQNYALKQTQSLKDVNLLCRTISSWHQAHSRNLKINPKF